MERKAWNYDPYHVVFNPRVAISSAPYIRRACLDIKRLENKESQTKVQEVMQGQHFLSSVKQTIKKLPVNKKNVSTRFI